ncbi:MAG: Carbohydrate-selective porin OprB [Flavipsychrobacter sp.]|nr:Carbohydrate-selective porin OprB [Flavipsychrobacter sp.]
MRRLLVFILVFSCALNAEAQGDSMAHRLNLHFQTTYIYQYKPEFDAKYSGTNSFKNVEERQNSLTATLYFGARLWKGGALYINPEIAGGSGLSGAFGLGAASNGETFRVGNPEPTLYLGRAYLSHTIALKGGSENVEEGANEAGGKMPVNYLRFYLGKFSIGDLFDNNAYANSPRSQFMNWCLMSNGAFDYAANVRGYTYAFVPVLQLKNMTYKVGLATLPVTANGADLNTDLGQEYSANAEVARGHKIKGKDGNVRVLVYQNNAHMGSYRESIQMFHVPGGVPDITGSRMYGRTKTGFGINADQQLSKNVGVFARAGWNDGKTETWAFTEVDRSLSAGVAVNGAGWKRKDDNMGIAIAMNGLSKDHSDYLNAGGLGFQLGDGKLSDAYETAAEIYYSYKPVPYGIWLSGDYQFILNPGYNSDRGPANVFSVRLHVEL